MYVIIFVMFTDLLAALNWIVSFQLDILVNRVEKLSKCGKTAFEVRNDSQVFNAITLSVVYAQRTIFYVFYQFVNNLTESAEKSVLLKLLSFYGAYLVTKNAAVFHQGSFFLDPRQIELYQEGILNLLPILKDEAVSLIDAIAPTDFILNSPLGMSDGNIYTHLQRCIMQSSDALQRPKWWRDVIHKEYLTAKL